MTLADLTTTTFIAKLDNFTQVTKFETRERENGQLVKVRGYWGGMNHGRGGQFEFEKLDQMNEAHPEFANLKWVPDPSFESATLAGQMTEYASCPPVATGFLRFMRRLNLNQYVSRT